MFRKFSRPVSGLLAALVLSLSTPLYAEQWRASSPDSSRESGASQQVVVDLLQRQEALQEEIRQLRNQVDVQGNEIQRLQNRLRSVSEDLDRRIQGLERGGAVEQKPAATGTSRAPAATSDGGDQKAYEAAFRLMKQGDYSRAAQSFRSFLVKYPASSLAGNAQYWIGESNYLVRNFKQGLEEFEKVLKDHPNSRKVPDAMLKIGYCHYELRDYAKAREVLSEIEIRYPSTLVARSAKSRLNLMKKEGR
jgi:tol-pal system protein YbgF